MKKYEKPVMEVELFDEKEMKILTEKPIEDSLESRGFNTIDQSTRLA